jgi:geranylgeranyl diphosphate synthase, type II
MSPLKHLDRALEQALKSHESIKGPPLLSKAIRHAVFPGGARIRPQLTLAVAQACGNDDPQLSMASAISIEMIHCASLVHDDLPCFDNADMRRGQTSVHKEYGERLAVLTGDALIVMAYETVAAASRRSSHRLAPIIKTISQGVGVPFGIIAGQSWECETQANLSDYQRAKTGALFAAATSSGAQAAGADAETWRGLGEWLGEAYQIADDIRDVLGDAQLLGKPSGQDQEHHRPSSAKELGLNGAVEHFDLLVGKAVSSIPSCMGDKALKKLVAFEAERLLPSSWFERGERHIAIETLRQAA